MKSTTRFIGVPDARAPSQHASRSTRLTRGTATRPLPHAVAMALFGVLFAASTTAHASSSVITRYTYDAGDHVTTVTDPRGLVTAYNYDGLGQLWGVSSPDTGATTADYDAYGRRSNLTRANNVTTTYGYDAINRLASVSAGGQAHTFTYDNCTNGLGRLCSVSDATGSTAYTYTAEGWIAGRAFSVSGTAYSLGYDYDAMGHLAAVTYPDGHQALYNYSRGAVSGITFTMGSTQLNAASNVTWRPMDAALASWTSSNGLTNTLAYDTDGRLTGISAPGVEGLGYSYDTTNRLAGINNVLDGTMSQDFGYDDQSRLVSVYSPSQVASYSYDANGNRLTSVTAAGTSNTVYSATSNRLVSTTGADPQSYGYDALGNLTSLGGTAYQYDAFNRMSTAGSMSYYVNPEGQRLRKSGSIGTTYFAPDVGGTLLAEYANGAWIDYVWLGGRLIGREVNGQLEAIHDDQLGRPQVVTNASQAVVWSAQNSAFTRNVTVSNSAPLNLGFPGQYYDTETGLWNNGFRDYDPALGRYVESDPLGLAGGINTYAYVGNNPISLIDPLGLCDQQKCTAARALVASLGQQLSAEGKVTTWTGIGLVTASGIGAIFAPEAAPAEVAGAETGAGLIDVGGVISTIGGTMTAYANGGVRNAAVAFGAGLLISKINQGAAGWGAASGVSETNQAAVSGLLDQSSEAVLEQEAACNAQ